MSYTSTQPRPLSGDYGTQSTKKVVLNKFIGNASIKQLAVNTTAIDPTKYGGRKTSPRPQPALAVLLPTRRSLVQNNHNKRLKNSCTLELALTKIIFPRMDFHWKTHTGKPQLLSWFAFVPHLPHTAFCGFFSSLSEFSTPCKVQQAPLPPQGLHMTQPHP